MPLYEYRCRDCSTKFEELVGRTVPEKTPLCPSCGSRDCERLFSTFAANTGKGLSSSSCSTGGFT
jgi:putative FmdB family regulatory protein